MNERAVGHAIKRSGIDRNEIFVPSKLWPSVCRAGAEAINATHSRLDTDYLDMLILHQPAGGYVRAWKAMEDAYAQGKIRTLGLSNFSEKQIQKVLASAHVMPQIVTVECHPCHQQRELRSYLKARSILLEAWYPLGHGDRRLLEEPVFVRLAKRYGKTPAQTVLRWHVQMGTSVIPSSTNPAHISADADIFDSDNRYLLDQVSVHANGDIVVSPYIPLVVGNIRNHPLEDYWNNGLSSIWSTKLVQDLCNHMWTIDDMERISDAICDIDMGGDLHVDLIDDNADELLNSSLKEMLG